MEAKDPLSDMADIHLPQPVSFWPPAPLWWVLAALVLAALGYAVLLWYRRWQQRQRLAEALAEIRNARQEWLADSANGVLTLALLQTCNSVLKRVALVHHADSGVAGLSGQRWLAFLDDTGGGQDFSHGDARLLADAGYRRSSDASPAAINAVIASAERWIGRQYQPRPRPGKAPAAPAAVQS